MSMTLFSVVVNQAGVERVFSFLKKTTKDHRNRLGIEKMEKTLKVCTIQLIMQTLDYRRCHRFMPKFVRSTARTV
jgi:hypothetical protein